MADNAIDEAADEHVPSDETVPVNSYIGQLVEWFGAAAVSEDVIDETSSPSLFKSISDFFNFAQHVLAEEVDTPCFAVSSADTPTTPADGNSDRIRDVSESQMKDKYTKDVTAIENRNDASQFDELFDPKSEASVSKPSMLRRVIGQASSSINKAGKNLHHRHLSPIATGTEVTPSAAVPGPFTRNYSINPSTKKSFTDNEPTSLLAHQVGKSVHRSLFAPSTLGTKITGTVGTVTREFGQSVSISDTVMVIGASGSDVGSSPYVGCVAIYEKDASNDWTEVQTVCHPAPREGHQFGGSVAVSDSGNTIAIGDPSDDLQWWNYRVTDHHGKSYNLGSVYIYTKSNGSWTQKAKIIASNPTILNGETVNGLVYTGTPGPHHGDHFGSGVAVSDTKLIVGAEQKDLLGFGTATGGVYVFDISLSSESDIMASEIFINHSPHIQQERLGTQVSLSGDTFIVSRRDSAYVEHERARIFNEQVDGSWVETVINSPDSTVTFFGYSASIAGDVAVIGAPGLWSTTTDPGHAYVAERDNSGAWSIVQTLTASDGVPGDYFGNAVYIS